MPFGDEFRLVHALILNAAVLIVTFTAARRWTADPIRRCLDALLLWFAVQYISVCLPGILHVLSSTTISLTAALQSTGLLFFARKTPYPKPQTPNPSPSRIFLIAALFTLFAGGGLVYVQREFPLIDYDAMTYHVPVAVNWLQSGRLGLLPVWFFNPANTFSPLAGSTFITWWIAPLGNDTLARAVQWPPTWLLFFSTLQIARSVNLPPIIAALMAVGVTLSRPFSSELMSARDDVFLAAFIATAIAACGKDALGERFGPWRLGIAVGLAAATKYTFFFAAPVLLMAFDAPFKAGWKRRQWAIAVSSALVIAGPWYARNWLLTGNPFYPIDINVFGWRVFNGLFTPARSVSLTLWTGIRDKVLFGFHAPPPLLLAVLVIGWLMAAATGARRAWRDPLVRACLFGLPICLLIFLMESPYAEVRFLFPALVPLYVAVGLGIYACLPWPAARWGLAAAVAGISIFTSFEATTVLVSVVLIAIGLTAAVAVLIRLDRREERHRCRGRAYAGTAAALAMGIWIYIDWHAYVEHCRDAKKVIWDQTYRDKVGAWRFIAENVPIDARIAYTNTYLIYPLYGDALSRRLIYIPLSRDRVDFTHVPRVADRLSGEQIEGAFTRFLNQSPDAEFWRAAIVQSGARYLVIFPSEDGGKAPESELAAKNPTLFTRVFQQGSPRGNRLAEIYQIHP